MVRKSADLGFWLLVLAFMAGLAAYGQTPRDFSADQVVLDEGKVLDSTKLYVSGQKTRSEMNALGGLITIIRRDLRVSWTLMPQSKTYYEKSLSAEELKMPLGAIPNEISRERVGRERILGYSCTKYRVSYSSTRDTQTALVWHANALGMPIRMEIPNVMTSEMRNIQIQPQPAGLFEIPIGYTKSAAPVSGDRSTLLGILGAIGGAGGILPPNRQPTVAQTRRGRGADTVPSKTALKMPVQASAMEFNMDRPGSDYRDFDLNKPEPNLCAAACARETQCKAWTYAKPGFQGPNPRCWLKDEVPDQMENEGCISGRKGIFATAGMETAGMETAGMEYNTNRNGSDYRDMDLRSPDPKACQTACVNDSKCRAWTYVKPGVQGDAAHCWLKDEVPEPTEDENCISGLKGVLGTAGMEYNTNRNGSDYRDMDLRSPDPKVCQTACVNDSKCRAWTYVKPGVQGDAAHCWLKDEVPEPTEDENCISGLKSRKR